MMTSLVANRPCPVETGLPRDDRSDIRRRLDDFFETRGIDDYAIISAETLNAPEGYGPNDVLASCRSVIVFGKQVPAFVQYLDKTLSSFRTNRQEMSYLDRVSYELADMFVAEGSESIAVPTLFPARIRDGKLRGILSLKHLAVAGGMGCFGRNTLMISEKFGNGLALSAVLTEQDIEPTNRTSRDVCLKCNRCVESCPHGAIDENGVKLHKCVNFTYLLPAPLRLVLEYLLKIRPLARQIETVSNLIGGNCLNVCNRCVIACPHHWPSRKT